MTLLLGGATGVAVIGSGKSGIDPTESIVEGREVEDVVDCCRETSDSRFDVG